MYVWKAFLRRSKAISPISIAKGRQTFMMNVLLHPVTSLAQAHKARLCQGCSPVLRAGAINTLILANYTSWHRAMDEVTPWPGTEQLRDLLAPKDRGHLSLAQVSFHLD